MRNKGLPGEFILHNIIKNLARVSSGTRRYPAFFDTNKLICRKDQRIKNQKILTSVLEEEIIPALDRSKKARKIKLKGIL